jgi:hypothetical protein
MALAREQSAFAPEWGAFMPFYRPGAGVPFRMYSDVTVCPGQARQTRLLPRRQGT